MSKPSEIKFTATVETKKPPAQRGVSVSELPPDLVKFLESRYAEVMGDDTKEIVLTAESKADASRLGLYAAAWGKSRTPRLYVRKLPNGKMYPDNVTRLSVADWDSIPAENRPGRKK